MKRLIVVLISALVLFASCGGPKPAYKTKAGKQKLKKYNALQYGDPRAK